MERLFSGSLLGLLVLFGSGCTSIPSASVDLSEELGQQLQHIEVSHLALLDQFFEEKQKQLNHFVDNDWSPLFIENFYKKPKIDANWQIVVRERDPQQRLQFAIVTSKAIQKAIDEKRQQLLVPVNELHQGLRESIEKQYQQARAINNSITSLLHSAAKVTENRDRFLARAGVSQARIAEVIDKADESVNSLLGRAQEAEGKVDKLEGNIKQYITRIHEIKQLFESKGGD